jgi:hypothetical protein
VNHLTHHKTGTTNLIGRNENLKCRLMIAALALLMATALTTVNANARPIEPTMPKCIDALTRAQLADNVWQEDDLSLDDCKRLAIKAQGAALKRLWEATHPDDCDTDSDCQAKHGDDDGY